MGATSSSEWRSLCCCCCCVENKRRAVEIGDGSLAERLLDESDKGDAGGGGDAEADEKPSKTVVTDAWLLQVEETRRAASDRASRGSSDGGEDEEEGRDEERRTAWDLSEEDAEEARGPGEEGNALDAALDASGDSGDECSAKDSVDKMDSGSWQRSDQFSSRSTRDSYASATDRASGSMLFRESSEGGARNATSGDDDDDDDLEEDR